MEEIWERVDWAYIYKEWETYANHLGLEGPLTTDWPVVKKTAEIGQGSKLTLDLLGQYQEWPEKIAAVWIASFCRDLLQDYAYLLNGRAYSLIHHIYFQALGQFQSEGTGWAKPLTRLQPKLFISYRLLEHTDLTVPACLIELAMLQASLVRFSLVS